jgi:hypothetical protein
MQLALRDATTFDTTSAVVDSLELADTSRLTLDGKIDALDTTPVAGRARLVR